MTISQPVAYYKTVAYYTLGPNKDAVISISDNRVAQATLMMVVDGYRWGDFGLDANLGGRRLLCRTYKTRASAIKAAYRIGADVRVVPL